MDRPEFSNKIIDACTAEIRAEIEEQLRQKGRGIYISSHETLGIITEEYTEFMDAVHTNSPTLQRQELLDLAVAALAGMASIDSGDMQW